MDITKRRFKITEEVKGFSVEVEVPKFKTKMKWFIWGLWGRRVHYYDENDLQWAPVTIKGTLLYAGQQIPFASFPSMSAAREFVKSIQAPKRETIVGEEIKRNGMVKLPVPSND